MGNKKSVPAQLLRRSRQLLAKLFVLAKIWHGHVTALLHTVPKRTYLQIGGAALAVVVAGYSLHLFWPKHLVFSYSQKNCFSNLVLLPNFVAPQASPSFEASLADSFSIGHYPLLSRTTCVVPKIPPQANTTETISLHPLKIGLKKSVSISVPPAPQASIDADLSQPVGTTAPIMFKLNSPDNTFKYQLIANEHKVVCPAQQETISCDLSQLPLAYSTPYEIQLQRAYKGKAETIFRQTITTVEALSVAASTIGHNELVRSAPNHLVLTFNKPVHSVEGLQLQQHGGGIITTAGIINGNTLTVQFAQPLPRLAQFTLTLPKAIAQDKAAMWPFTLNFGTAGGPQVAGVSLGHYRVSPGAPFTLAFDSNILPEQHLAHFIRVEVGGHLVQSTVTLHGHMVVVSPAALPACTPFTVRVIDGLQNEFGVSGGSGWQMSSRTTCQVVFGIGTSVQGRSIIGYRFGNGPSKIIFAGTLHGDEKSATHTLNSLLNDLEANAGQIPAHRTIIVIPNANPDGYAANTRLNANGVDLNRNFAANNWKPGVTMPDGSYHPNGGGTSPFSEPESGALANYVLSQAPRLVLSFHSLAGVVAANEAGDSRGLADIYASKSGLRSYGNEVSGIFAYDTTGAFEDWLHNKHGIPALLIELTTRGSNEFSRQKSAIWAMIQLP